MTLTLDETDGVISVRANDTLLARYRAETAASKPHVDWLALPPGVDGAGESLVAAAPHDHKWHLGLFFCQKLVDGINCWESEKEAQSGGLHGAATSVDYECMTKGATVGLKQTAFWTASDGERLLDDKRRLEIHPPENGGYLLTWTQNLDAIGHTRRLGSESIFGRYSGLSLRFIRSLAGGRVRLPDADSEQMSIDELNGRRGRWCDYSGKLDGFVGPEEAPTAGITVFNYPENDPHPTSWFIMNDSFGFLAANPTWGRIKTLDPAEPVTWRWGVWVHAGTPSNDAIDTVYEQFNNAV